MTREEEIYNAIKDLGIGAYNDSDPLLNDEYSGCDIQCAFIKGTEWADENPKSPWISVKDNLPKNETESFLIYCVAYTKNDSIVENKHYEIYLANFDKENKLWVNIESHNNYCFDVLYWMPIPKLPKE